jgi:hypothetical protein
MSLFFPRGSDLQRSNQETAMLEEPARELLYLIYHSLTLLIGFRK